MNELGVSYKRFNEVCRSHDVLLKACKKAFNKLDKIQQYNEERQGHIDPNIERLLAGLQQAINQAEG